MFCKNCGKEIPNGAKFCIECGNSIETEIQHKENEYNFGVNAQYVTLLGAVRNLFKNYIEFKGRATRSEFWFIILFIVIISILPILIGFISVFTELIPNWPSTIFYIINSLLNLAITLLHIATAGGCISLAIRRIHDAGYAWYYILFGLIPIFGLILLFIIYIKPSAPDNKWGPAPKRKD